MVKLGETPFELLKEEKEENMMIRETIIEKKVQLLNDSFIDLLKRQTESPNKLEATLKRSTSSNGCQICRAKDHLAIKCPKYTTSRSKCLKCARLHKTKNCGLWCNFYTWLGHIEEWCWKKKDPKTSAVATNYLEVMVDDEEAI